jgi:hypothetical protein
MLRFSIFVYRNNLKNREFGKEAAQILSLERATIAGRQGASEDSKSAAKLTPPKTDSSGCFGIMSEKNQLFNRCIF